MKSKVFAADGRVDDELIDDAFNSSSFTPLQPDTSGSFPVWDFLHLPFSRMLETDLMMPDCWAFLATFVPGDRLVTILHGWSLNLPTKERCEIEEKQQIGLLTYGRRSHGLGFLLQMNAQVIKSLREQLLKALVETAIESRKPAAWSDVGDQILGLLPLTSEDVSLIGMSYCYGQISAFNTFVDNFDRNKGAFLARLLGMTQRSLVSRLSSSAILPTLGILEQMSRQFLALSYDWQMALESLSLADQARENLKHDVGLKLPLENFAIPVMDRDLMLRLLRSPGATNILIYGDPGTGKSELARSLVLEASGEPWTFSNIEGGMNDLSPSDVLIARRLLQDDRQVLIIDEAEPYLGSIRGLWGKSETNFQNKAKINLLLDNAQGKVIWILNHIEQIDPSTLRRFPFIFSMPRPSRKNRLELWKYYADQSGLTSENYTPLWTDAARDYDVVPSVIAQTLKTAALMFNGTESQTLKTEIHRLVQSQAAVGNGKIRRSDQNQRWSLEVLNTSVSAPSLVAGATAWLASSDPDRPGQRFLFHGEPGTGKTEFARQLAHRLDIELVMKRASDLQSMWLGEAEKNIRRAFEEAEKAGALLVIDEIDTFLYSRSQAQRSWELSQVNEFLTCLESYRGLFVGTTNGLTRLDVAVLRRFHYKVEFRYLAAEQAATLATVYFPQVTVPEAFSWALLPPLAPGDFAAVADQANHPSSWEELRMALTAEAGLRAAPQRKIGFQ